MNFKIITTIKRTEIKARIQVFFFLLLTGFFVSKVDAAGWKAGVARTVITPKENIWMAGYASRDHASEGMLHDLWAKALALEDSLGNRAILITADILDFSGEVPGRIKEQLRQKLNLSASQIILNASHTHSGPVLSGASLENMYSFNDVGKDEKEKIRQYTSFFETQVVALAEEAFRAAEPVLIFSGNGVARFQVNRRNNSEKNLTEQTELKGPNDPAIPVLKVVSRSGSLKALVFGYACHPTVLDGYLWCGDYPGFAQIELEKKHPDAIAMFFQGAGADQNPLPRSTISLAKQYGITLSAAVERVLDEPMRLLPAILSTAYTEIDLPLTPAPTATELEKVIAESTVAYRKRCLEGILSRYKIGKMPIVSYPYPLQIWNVGGQPVMSMGGELVIEYALGLKKMFGHDIFVMGYCNDVMAYIPSATILKEGGYEGESSQLEYGLPSKWSLEIEPLIYDGMSKLAAQVNIKQK